MNKKLWDEFLESKVAINCKRVDEAEEFMKLCDKNNIKWSSGENATEDTNWEEYKEKTCYTNKFCDCTGLGYARIKFCKNEGLQIVAYQELMEDKKAFTGPELAQAILDGEFKAGVKFKSDAGFEYKICPYGTHLDLYDTNDKMVSSGVIIWRTFTLIEEPKFYFLNQAIKSNKQIKLKDWENYHDIEQALSHLSRLSKETIQEALTMQVWLEE